MTTSAADHAKALRLMQETGATNPAEHVAELKAIVRNATKPTEYEETP